MRVQTETTVRVPAGTRLVLNSRQFATRAFALDVLDVEESAGGRLVMARQTLEFKRGEIIDVEALPKDWAGKVKVLPPAEVAGDGAGEPVDAPEAPAEPVAEAAPEAPAEPVAEAAPEAPAEPVPAAQKPGKAKPKQSSGVNEHELA